MRNKKTKTTNFQKIVLGIIAVTAIVIIAMYGYKFGVWVKEIFN